MSALRPRRKATTSVVKRHENESSASSMVQKVRPPQTVSYNDRKTAIKNASLNKNEFGLVSMTKSGAVRTKELYEKMGYTYLRYFHDIQTNVHVTVYINC